MYLKSIEMVNFRKFRDKDNIIGFVDAEDYKKDKLINIAPKTTLIIGKNNSGKTTVIEALKKLVNNEGFYASDFNYNYLNELLSLYTLEYLESDEIISVPTLKFVISIGIENSKDDLLTNLIPFMSIGDIEDSEVKIIAKWTAKNSELFVSSVKQFIMNDYMNQRFDRFLDLINDNDFSLSYYNLSGEKRVGFSLTKLIDLEAISANNINSSECLSKAFSKIVDYRYKNLKKTQGTISLNDMDKEIIAINQKLTSGIDKEHTSNINTSLGKMISGQKCKVLLKSDLNFQTLLKTVLKYEYIEGNNHIPEQQFGLGYTNLMMIIADIITYMEKYPETAFNSQINLISIEEPETFMHPQMQELFIKNINEMVSSLLDNNDKHVNSQIIITTHSPHILNSKIHEGNTFNNINYITTVNNSSKAVCLNDNTMISEKKSNKGKWKRVQNLKFLKKHIKFKVSELFFADAVIMVEGITEYTLLQYYIDNDVNLSKYYISLVLINGAHAKVYENLIYSLNIPTIIITDIDIKRDKIEKNEKDEKNPNTLLSYLQIDDSNLNDRKTTNTTLSYFYNTTDAKTIISEDYKIKDNLMILCQKQKIKGYYATSFEEAFILSNESNKILNDVLERIKPDIYTSVISSGGLVKNSYMLQKKLSDSKSDFANELLYRIVIADKKDDVPVLPQYIKDGLDFLQKQLGGK